MSKTDVALVINILFLNLIKSNIVYLIHLQYKIYITKFSRDFNFFGSICAAT